MAHGRTGDIVEDTIPPAVAALHIATGANGNLRFPESRNSGKQKIDRTMPAGAITETHPREAPGHHHRPGRQLWITEAGNQRIAKFVIATGAVT